jgi:hypothetical protein
MFFSVILTATLPLLLPVFCLEPLRHIERFVQSSQSPCTQLLVVLVQQRFEFFTGTERGYAANSLCGDVSVGFESQFTQQRQVLGQ